MFYKSCYTSPIGAIYIVCDQTSLVGLWLENQKYFAEKLINESVVVQNNSTIKMVKKWLDDYFAKRNPNVDKLVLNPKGTVFQKEVWKILMEIPYGEVTTYGEIAKLLANKMGINKMSAQAVGGAVGRNPISIIVPCHRVVGAKGDLTGYAGGIEKKLWLLKHENSKFKKNKNFRIKDNLMFKI